MRLKKRNLICISALLLIGCGAQEEGNVEAPGQEETPEGPEENNQGEEEDPIEETPAGEEEISEDLKAWLPRQENVMYSYESEYAEEELDNFTSTRYNQFIHEDTVQFSTVGYENTTVTIYEYLEDSVVEVFNRQETFFRDNFIETDFPSPIQERTILQLPLEIGNTWEGAEGEQFEITGTDVEVKTPAGTYNTLEVTMTQGEMTEITYYAENVGVVQQTTSYNEDGSNPATSYLVEIQEDVPETREIAVYPLDEEGTTLVQEYATLEMYTNENQIDALTAILQGNTEAELLSTMPLFTENAQINSMYLDTEGVIQLDMSEAFVEEMNVGAGIEGLIIQGIVNTVSHVYGSVLPVQLSIDGGPYESGHLIIDEEEIIEPDYENVLTIEEQTESGE